MLPMTGSPPPGFRRGGSAHRYYLAEDQTEGLQQASDLPVQLDADLHQVTPGPEQRQALVRDEAFGGDLPSNVTAPLPSITQTLISFSEASSAT
jgi:hypothetical protein